MTSNGGRLTPDVTRVSLPKPMPLDVATSTQNTRRSTMSQSRTLFIGMDVHQETIAVAHVAQEHGAAVTSLGTIGTRQGDLDPLVRTSVGRPRSGSGGATSAWGHAANTPMSSPGPLPGSLPALCGRLPNRCRSHPKAKAPIAPSPRTQKDCQRALDETQPRFGVTLGSVMRLGKDTRAETEAGTRRRQVRWEPTHA